MNTSFSLKQDNYVVIEPTTAPNGSKAISAKSCHGNVAISKEMRTA